MGRSRRWTKRTLSSAGKSCTATSPRSRPLFRTAAQDSGSSKVNLTLPALRNCAHWTLYGSRLCMTSGKTSATPAFLYTLSGNRATRLHGNWYVGILTNCKKANKTSLEHVLFRPSMPHQCSADAEMKANL